MSLQRRCQALDPLRPLYQLLWLRQKLACRKVVKSLTFRSFDYRSVDTKIIREVWNELQECLGKYDGRPFPIKAEDLFDDTYKLHPDDLDDAYWAVADRLGIDTENPENNPYWNKVTSVKNLVLFLHNQPRLKTHNKSFKPTPKSGAV